MSQPQLCPECGGVLHFFEPKAATRAVDPASLPSACQQCHGIFLQGARLALPVDFEKKAVSLAVQADRSAKQALEQMKLDPELRVERYISETYRTAYMTGFFRAMAYFQHQAKEGRLIRLSRLWAGFRKTPHRVAMVDLSKEDSVAIVVEIPSTDYHEFDTLLQVRTTKGNGHVEGDADTGAPGTDGEAQVPRSTGTRNGSGSPVQ